MGTDATEDLPAGETVRVERSGGKQCRLKGTLVFSSLTAFSSLSLFSVFVVLMRICRGVVLFWSSLFGVLEASCT
jgi:hypothetical protein